MRLKNYLFELYPNFPRDFEVDSRKEADKINGELYDDLKEIFFDDNSIEKIGLKKIINKRQNSKNGDYYTLFVDGDKFLLSADYIGPSVHWAQCAGLTDVDIICFLFISRTIGGHIVFPRGGLLPTVNQARGGKRGYYDRFDLTLYALKQWFSNKKNSKINNAIENYGSWFELFIKDKNSKDGFKNFIEFFSLEEFVSENLEIIDLVNSDLKNDKVILLGKEDISIPNTKESYLQYVRNSNIIIWKRTKKLLKYVNIFS